MGYRVVCYLPIAAVEEEIRCSQLHTIMGYICSIALGLNYLPYTIYRSVTGIQSSNKLVMQV